MTVEFHHLAVQEFREARDWYRQRSPQAADRFMAALHRGLDWAAANFAALQGTSYGCRWVRLKRYPYLLVLQEDAPGDLFVVAVSHTRRRPAYWRRRI